MDIWAEQRRLSKILGVWGVGSVVKGGTLALAGRRRGDRVLERYGRQTVAWGAIDAAIAGFGAHRSRGKRDAALAMDDEAAAGVAEDERASLRRLLLLNTALDVGYIAGGAWWRRRSPGDGGAVIVQGAFLLVLDVTFALRTRPTS